MASIFWLKWIEGRTSCLDSGFEVTRRGPMCICLSKEALKHYTCESIAERIGPSHSDALPRHAKSCESGIAKTKDIALCWRAVGS